MIMLSIDFAVLSASPTSQARGGQEGDGTIPILSTPSLSSCGAKPRQFLSPCSGGYRHIKNWMFVVKFKRQFHTTGN